MADEIRVLIVDDNEINGMLAAQLVQAFGLATVVAPSGEKAVELADREEYAFILMDHIMPGMDGVETTSIIRSRHAYPVYAMTGDLTVKTAAAFKEAGATESISKPLKPVELLKIIRECVPEGCYTVPAEVAASEHMAAAAELPPETAVLKSCMSTVNGLDVEAGLKNSLGNSANYLHLLKAASSNIRQYVNILREYMETAEPQRLKLAAHSLKSVFANIGIEFLRKESEKVESIASELLEETDKAGGIASFDFELQNRMNEYISHTMNAALELEAAIEAYEKVCDDIDGQAESDTGVQALSVEDMTEVVDYVRTAFRRYEIDYILEGLEYLKKASVAEERAKIKEAINLANAFEYDRALELFEEVAELKKGRGEAR